MALQQVWGTSAMSLCVTASVYADIRYNDTLCIKHIFSGKFNKIILWLGSTFFYECYEFFEFQANVISGSTTSCTLLMAGAVVRFRESDGCHRRRQLRSVHRYRRRGAGICICWRRGLQLRAERCVRSFQEAGRKIERRLSERLEPDEVGLRGSPDAEQVWQEIESSRNDGDGVDLRGMRIRCWFEFARPSTGRRYKISF